MNLTQILDGLRFCPEDKLFPRELLDSAIELKEEITPILLRELEDVSNDPQIFEDDDSYIFPYYAMFLLAKFREPKAFPYILKLFSLPPDFVDHCFGSITTESLCPLLSSTYNGDLQSIIKFIKNPQCFAWARCSACHVIVALVFHKQLDRATAQEHQLDLLDSISIEKELILCFSILDSIMSLYPEGILLTKFEKALANKNADPHQDLHNAYEEIKKNGKVTTLNNLCLDDNNHYVESLERHMVYWQCFENDSEESMPDHALFDMRKKDPWPLIAEKKIGRNDPCPCGSGKKYKKCCG